MVSKLLKTHREGEGGRDGWREGGRERGWP
jgi:hypothetical protein